MKTGVTVVIGGQFGSEAKGKCVVHLAKKHGCDLGIRSGGPNAGHTIWVGEGGAFRYVARQLPSVVAIPGVPVAIAAGGMVDVNLLYRELSALESFGVSVRDRLTIDPNAVIVEDNAGDQERSEGMSDRLGSTQTGTGITQANRVMRKARLAKDSATVRHWVGDVTAMANGLVDKGKHVIIEGTQGFGLSLYHGGFYPMCTSRDTTASGFASEAGISPKLVKEIWMVLRTWPIRVGGNSGDLFGETTWEEVAKFAGIKEPLVEMTSVTKKVRRVGTLDLGLLRRAIMVNRPDYLAVHGMDYWDVADKGKTSYAEMGKKSRDLLDRLLELGVPVGQVYTGPHQDDLIDMLDFPGQEMLPFTDPDGEGSEL